MIDWISAMPDVEDMDLHQLQALQAQLMEKIAELDAREPKNVESEAYDAWADAHEELEDLLDDVLDRLEEFA